MHIEIMVSGYYISDRHMNSRLHPIPYPEMCVYDSAKWEIYIQKSNSEPGFKYSVILN